MKVELIWDADCPNVEEARTNVRRAFAQAGVDPKWREWRRDDPAAPDYVRRYGSPTVLVDGVDVADQPAGGEANCCRVYARDDGGLSGVPAVEAIAERLRQATA